MGVRQRDRRIRPRSSCRRPEDEDARQPQAGSRARLRPARRLQRSRTLSQLRRADRLRRTEMHRVRRLRRYLPDELHHLHRRTAKKPTFAHDQRSRRSISRRTSTSPTACKTDRIMVKDEDVCLHCGLCAERCPTAAWDMQKFWYNVTKAGEVKYSRCNGNGSEQAG